MTVPLLLALGWSEQLLAVEWKNIDLAAFSHTPTDTESCILVCEAKGRGHGLQNTLKQALKYANALPHARKIVLTEGSRLYVYERVEGQWNAHPTGYLNIEKIRLAHLVPAGTNAIDTIMALSPAGANRPIPCNTYQGSGARITAAVPLVKRMM